MPRTPCTIPVRFQVNTYALGYYFNMYVGGTPLLRQGGCMIVVNDMPYVWDSPAHDCYREFFEQVGARNPTQTLHPFGMTPSSQQRVL